MTPELPAHIAAALRGAGGESDTAGQPWSGRDLSQGEYHRHQDDDGQASVGLVAALRQLRGAAAGEAEVVAALADARVFTPVVAVVSQSAISAEGLIEDKEAEMALVTLAAPDGRKALPIFSTVEALARWHPHARPVAVFAPRAALSAVAEEAELLVLDPASDFTFVVRRPAVWALAQQKPWIPSYADADLLKEIGQQLMRWATGSAPSIKGVRFSKGSGVDAFDSKGVVVGGGGSGPELCLHLELSPGLSQGQLAQLVDVANQAVARIPEMADRVDSLQMQIHTAV